MRRNGLFGIVLAIVIAIAIAPANTGRGLEAAGPPDEIPGLARAIEVQERHTAALIARAGVVGTAVGEGADGTAEILVLSARGNVGGIPGQLDGVRVRVLVTGEIKALCKTTVCPRPVPIGVSTGHPRITAGTIGARVRNEAGTVYALSNNHVYADTNRASLGDPVIQPGTFDGGTSPAHNIGTLSAFVPIKFGGTANRVDAAIAGSTPTLLGNATLADGYGTPRSQVAQPALRMPVQKYGRTTGLTAGRITGINATVNVNYGSPHGVALFTGQILIGGGAFSSGGDSGSLIVGRGGSADRQPVGLLFAGSVSTTVANPIGEVLSAFRVTIDGN